MKTRAVVQTGPKKLEMRDLPVPDIGDDSGLLRIEACGIRRIQACRTSRPQLS